jgi:hypothetical protein
MIPLQFEKATNPAFAEMPKDQRFPFSANHRQGHFHWTVVNDAIGHFHVTALQNSVFLLALSNAIISQAQIHFDVPANPKAGRTRPNNTQSGLVEIRQLDLVFLPHRRFSNGVIQLRRQ